MWKPCWLYKLCLKSNHIILCLLLLLLLAWSKPPAYVTGFSAPTLYHPTHFSSQYNNHNDLLKCESDVSAPNISTQSKWLPQKHFIWPPPPQGNHRTLHLNSTLWLIIASLVPFKFKGHPSCAWSIFPQIATWLSCSPLLIQSSTPSPTAFPRHRYVTLPVTYCSPIFSMAFFIQLLSLKYKCVCFYIPGASE